MPRTSVKCAECRQESSVVAVSLKDGYISDTALQEDVNVSNYSAMIDVGGATCRKFPIFSGHGYLVWCRLQNVYSRFRRSFQIRGLLRGDSRSFNVKLTKSAKSKIRSKIHKKSGYRFLSIVIGHN